MRTNRWLFLATLLLAACTADPTIESVGDTQTPVAIAQKLVNTSKDAQAGSLLVYLSDNAVAQIENNATRAANGRVVTRSGIVDVDNVLDKIGVTSLHRLFPLDTRNEAQTRAAGLHKWYVLNFPSEVDLDVAATELASIAEVSRVQFNAKLQIEDTKAMPLSESTAATRAAGNYPFNDPYFSLQWDMLNTGDPSISTPVVAGADVDVAPAWQLTGGDPSIVVAVDDLGVKYTHPDLADNMWVNTAEKNGQTGVDDDGNGYVDDIYGYNFADNTGQIKWDLPGDSGHGTHVAGTIAAVNNNGIGVSSIAGGTGHGDGVRLMSCQIFSGNTGGDAYTSAASIKYAADNGACILQCSWSYGAGAFYSDDEYESYAGAEKDAIDYFIANATNPAITGGKGGLVIFGVANDMSPVAGYPAAYRDYIGVTGFGPDYLPAYYTNYGPGSNIAAPGGDYYVSTDLNSGTAEIPSTVPTEIYGGDYGYMQGTSMATPHVSGVAALGLSYAVQQGKTFTLDEFKAMLLTSVNAFDYSRFTGTKIDYTTGETLTLSDCIDKMGTGAVDAYQLLMQIDGTPLLRVATGEVQMLPLDRYFGAEASRLTYLGVEMSDADMTKLGMETAPTIVNGQLALTCTNPGVAKITVHAIAGGAQLGTGNTMGGMEITKEFAIIARKLSSSNGGWL